MNRTMLPIVIGGCHRSGTTLVRYILDSHSRIYCGPEMNFFRDFFEDWISDPLQHARFFHGARALLPEDELFQIMGRAFIEIHERAAKKHGKPRWADKAPSHALWVSKWQMLLGNDWLYVHVLRNPLDTLSSMKDHPMPRCIPSGLDGHIEHYRRYVETGLNWVRRYPDRACLLLYENLVLQPEPTCSAWMKWLGEVFEPSQLSFTNVAHDHGLGDPEIHATRGIHSSSVGAWRSKLSPDEATRIWSQLGPLWKDATQISRASYLP